MHAATLRATDIVLAAGALVVTALEATLLSRYGATWVTLGNLGVHVAVTGALAVRHDLPRVSAAVTVIALGYLDVLAWQSPVNLGVSPLLLALPLAVHLTARREPFGWASMGLVAAIAVGYFSPMRLLPSRTDQNVWTLLFLVTILGAFVLGAARRHSDIVYEGKLSRSGSGSTPRLSLGSTEPEPANVSASHARCTTSSRTTSRSSRCRRARPSPSALRSNSGSRC